LGRLSRFLFLAAVEGVGRSPGRLLNFSGFTGHLFWRPKKKNNVNLTKPVVTVRYFDEGSAEF
jgi:hypothetical protein